MIGNGMPLETPKIAQGVKTNPDGSTPSAEGGTPVSGQFYESDAISRNGASAGHGDPASAGFAKALRRADWSGVKDKRTETLLGSFQAGASASRLMLDGPPPIAVAGLESVTAHALRRSFASVAGDLDFTESTIGAILGHSSGSTTSRYVHRLDSVLIAAANRIAGEVHRQMTGEEPKVVQMPKRAKAR